MEAPKGIIIKTITWRISALLTTWVIVYLFNRNIKESTAISFTANIVTPILYYFRERAWNRITFGKKG